MVTVDVLHCLDLGVTQDLVGNIVYEYARNFAHGRSLKQKISHTWGQLTEHYRAMATPCRLQALTLEMVRKEGKSPKIRAKGGETRGLLSFAMALAMDMRDEQPGSHYYQTIDACCGKMMDVYILLDNPHMGFICRQ